MNLDSFLEGAIEQLKLATTKRRHPFKIANIASVTKSNLPDARSLAIRDFYPQKNSIIFHTDVRSPKVEQLQHNNAVVVLFYSVEHNLQLRFFCQVDVEIKSALSRSRWDKLTPNQKKMYAAKLPQGSKIDSPTDMVKDGWKDLESDENFAVLNCQYKRLDVLQLSYNEHIRAEYFWDKNKKLVEQSWIVP